MLHTCFFEQNAGIKYQFISRKTVLHLIALCLYLNWSIWHWSYSIFQWRWIDNGIISLVTNCFIFTSSKSHELGISLRAVVNDRFLGKFHTKSFIMRHFQFWCLITHHAYSAPDNCFQDVWRHLLSTQTCRATCLTNPIAPWHFTPVELEMSWLNTQSAAVERASA